jgi:cell wall assembly regulator SMI1
MLESSTEEVDISYLSEYEEGDVDPKINPDVLLPGTYLHFSDCMNNGGTPSLYLDFNPTDQGVSGQVICFLHDPDEFKVIANSFDEYLQGVIDDDSRYVYKE